MCYVLYVVFLLDNNKAVKVVIELLNSNLDYDRQCLMLQSLCFNNSFINTASIKECFKQSVFYVC